MIARDGTPNVLEFNCRFGDPETQPILMRLQSDLVDVVRGGASTARSIACEAKWDSRAALGVVMAAGGYPESYRKGDADHRPRGGRALAGQGVSCRHPRERRARCSRPADACFARSVSATASAPRNARPTTGATPSIGISCSTGATSAIARAIEREQARTSLTSHDRQTPGVPQAARERLLHHPESLGCRQRPVPAESRLQGARRHQLGICVDAGAAGRRRAA